MLSPSNLLYDLCICCGCMTDIGVKVCKECKRRGFEKIKKTTAPNSGYPEMPDPLDWMDECAGLSPGYSESEAKIALKELLSEIKERSDESRSRTRKAG